MEWLTYGLLAIYCLCLLFIAVYCLAQFHLLWHFERYKRHFSDVRQADAAQPTLPYVTVQLPIFNEQYVVERLLHTIAGLEYPRDRLQVQVLDDSTDETTDLVRQILPQLQAEGLDITLHHRIDRSGFKAGALKAAMPEVKGEFIAIFDADFVPPPDFLLRTVPYFDCDEVGVVQTRWAHINEDYSLVTRLQALQLNVHFTVEQCGRYAGGKLLQFNGTAGIWRKSTIEDAGGWHSDTLTEDLDLSYRAQLKGWQIKYLEHVHSPAELPAEMGGLKSQQYRWMKGGAENARKLLPSILKADLKPNKRLHAMLHLLSSSVFLVILATIVVSLPLLFLLQQVTFPPAWSYLSLSGFFALVLVFFAANVRHTGRPWSLGSFVRFLALFPVFLSLSMGLSLHNSIAVIQGWLGRRTPFVRTPKFNLTGLQGTYRNKAYRSFKINWVLVGEGLLAVCFLGAIVFGILYQNVTFILLHLMAGLGFSGIFLLTVRDLARR